MMKKTEILATLVAAFMMAVPFQTVQAQSETLSKVASVLTSGNGISAGKALLSLYTQYKSAGKLDFSNPTNVQTLLTLAQNIKGLSTKQDNTSFLGGLISGSKNLVNSGNSASVLNSLASIANLDTSSLTKAAASSAATSLLSKVSSKKSSSSSASESTASAASSILTGLFSSL